MGLPSPTEPWGWQLDGDHLIVNFFVLRDQVVMTPLFVGGEPIVTESGKYAGNASLQDEHARIQLDQVQLHLNDTYFAWIGGSDANAVFYYQIQTPDNRRANGPAGYGCSRVGVAALRAQSRTTR